MNDKPLPQDKSVESAILGEILLGTESSIECLPMLKSDHFMDYRNQVIFNVINDMVKKSEHVDAVTVASKAKSLSLIDQAGGCAYIAHLPFESGRLSADKYISILDEKLRLRKIIELASLSESKAYENVDSNNIFNEIEDQLFKLQDVSNSENLLEKSSIILLENLERKMRGEIVTGIKTGIEAWDRSLGGLNPLFYVLAARGRMGKTAMVSQMISRMLSEKRPVLIFEKDMSAEMFQLRMACSMVNVSFTKYDLGYASKLEYEDVRRGIEFIRKSPLYIYSPSNFNISTFTSIIKKERRVHGVECVFLDHILKIDVGNDYRTGLTLASGRIRDSVEENKIPHVILAQLNRGSENTERPNSTHIKEFDALFADCDVMNFLWSDKELLDVPPSEMFPMKLTCGKNRYGSQFEDDIYFDRPLMKFREKLL